MHKLGFYLHLSLDQHGLWEAIRRVQPPVILIHADTANTMLLTEIRRFRAPDAFVIGRLFKDVHTQRQMLESDDPEGAGRSLADEILRYDFGLATKRSDNGRLLIDAWMSLNEAVPGPASEQFRQNPIETGRLLHNYDRFQVAFRQRLQEAGVEAVAFNFGAGNFQTADHYLEFFPNTLANYTYLGFHEYGWPTLQPAPGSATSAVFYRRCLEGIRAQHGDRYQVIITEAGLTRMYQNPQWGDVGWLNNEAPLTEENYWQSLAWYNEQLCADANVLGACLYQVGHHGDWASFRHLGEDNAGHSISIVDRIAALKEAAPRGLESENPTMPLMPLTTAIHGVIHFAGRPVLGAAVRLLGGGETLGMVREAAVAAPTAVTWTRRVSGFTGTLWNCWRKYVATQVAGLTYAEFKRLALIYNPALQAANAHFNSSETYLLPENGLPAPLAWDRPLTGFAGSIWQCWQQYVENKVVGLTYADFRRAVLSHNPKLKDKGRRFQADQRYSLPRNVGQKEYALQALTDAQGRYRFANLPAGEYRLEVTAPGALRYATEFSCEGETGVDVLLRPILSLAEMSSSVGTRGVSSPNDFVRVVGDEFVVNQQALRFIGVNIRGLVHYGDPQTLQWATTGHRADQLRAAYEMGARVVRVFLPSMHASPAATIARLQEVFTVVRQMPGLYLLPALSNLYADVPFRVPGDESFYARIDPNFHADLLNATFFTGGYQQNFLPFVRQIVQSFRDETRIFAWEIGNELKLNPTTGNPASDPNVAAFINFNHAIAREIHAIDPNHLVTTGMISTHHAWLHNDDLRRRLYGSSLIDFITVHCYNEEYENDDSALARLLHKPFIVEEAGFGNRYGRDRSAKTAEDMQRWFGLNARGYMPWGFMATPNDMGDGDGDSGMDRTLHGDWDALFRVYAERARQLADEVRNLGTVTTFQKVEGIFDTVTPDGIVSPGSFQAGQQLFAQDWLNVRKSPGHLAKLGDDVVGQLAPSAAITLTGNSVAKDGLIWWPITGTLPSGAAVTGWAAEALPNIELIGVVPPPLGRAVAQARGAGEQRYAASWVNLRRDPGYVSKPGDDMLGQIPYGALMTLLEGPVETDGLTWWRVRAPLQDNSVAEGWAAATDPNGIVLLTTDPPPPPEPLDLGVIGQAFRPGMEVTVVAAILNVRQSPGYVGKAAEHVIGMASGGTNFTLVSGPQSADGLEWWQVQGRKPDGSALAGWLAVVGPDGVRLIAPKGQVATLQLGHPFSGSWPLTQGWGTNAEYYAQFKYDGVALKGHNGLDFGTPPGATLLAVDGGKVLRVGFEAEGFGNFVVLGHAWGESLYAHLERIDLQQGVSVNKGDAIGASGESGKCFGPHLHFGLRLTPYRRTDGWGGFCDPSPFLDPAILVGSRSVGSKPEPMAPERLGWRQP